MDSLGAASPEEEEEYDLGGVLIWPHPVGSAKDQNLLIGS